MMGRRDEEVGAGVRDLKTAEAVLGTHGQPSERPWSLGTRLAFRFCFAYALIEGTTFALATHTQTLTMGLVGSPNWWASLNIGIGRWLIEHVIRLQEHSASRMSANNLPLVLGMLTVAVISAAIALVWSALDRRHSSHPRLFVWLHTSMRFVLAATMLSYGWAKLVPQQFPISLDYLALEVGQHNPRDLLWAFMSASRGYQIFAGMAEVAGALLLMARRTMMLGGVISMASMMNVLALDISYDVPVKFLAGQVFLMTLFVLAPFAGRLLSAFDLARAVNAAPIRRLLPSASLDRMARTLGVALSLWIVLATVHASSSALAGDHVARTASPLLGIWDVEAMTRNSEPVPLLITDTTLWRRLVVYSNGSAIIVPMTPSASSQQWTGRPRPIRYNVRLDSASQTVQLTPFPFYEPTDRVSFTYELPARDQLVLSGSSEDATTVIRLRRLDLSAYPLVHWERHWNW